jgi:hypothetical protein
MVNTIGTVILAIFGIEFRVYILVSYKRKQGKIITDKSMAQRPQEMGHNFISKLGTASFQTGGLLLSHVTEGQMYRE